MKQLYIDKVEAVWEKLLVEQLFLIVEDCKRSIILFYYFVSFLNFPLLILFFSVFSLHPQQPHAPYRLHPSTARRTNPPQLFRGFVSASSIDSVVSFFSRLPHLRTEPRRRPVPASANRAPPQQLRPSPFAGAHWRRWWGASMSTPPRLAQGAGRSCFF